MPPLEPEKIARFLALDEEIATRAAAIRRHDEQKREQQETAEHKARARSAELLAARGEGIRKAAQEREQQEAAEPAATPEPPQPAALEVPAVGQVILFPQWGDERRAAAAAIFRSALFPPLNFQKARPYHEQNRRWPRPGYPKLFD